MKKKSVHVLTVLVVAVSLVLAAPVGATSHVGFNVNCTGASGFGTVPAHGTYSWVVHFYDPRVGNAPVEVGRGTIWGGASGAPFNPSVNWPIAPTEGIEAHNSYYWWYVWDGEHPYTGTLQASGEGHFNCQPPPPPPLQGCTPGYWKQSQHFDSWVGYAPGNFFEDVFVRDVPGNPTLLQALEMKGGGLNALMRHATAALLNASNPNVNPDPAFDTTAEVIAAFRAAYDSGNYEATKNLLDASNNAGCPLN